jgi:hypothetical protein
VVVLLLLLIMTELNVKESGMARAGTPKTCSPAK